MGANPCRLLHPGHTQCTPLQHALCSSTSCALTPTTFAHNSAAIHAQNFAVCEVTSAFLSAIAPVLRATSVSSMIGLHTPESHGKHIARGCAPLEERKKARARDCKPCCHWLSGWLAACNGQMPRYTPRLELVALWNSQELQRQRTLA